MRDQNTHESSKQHQVDRVFVLVHVQRDQHCAQTNVEVTTDTRTSRSSFAVRGSAAINPASGGIVGTGKRVMICRVGCRADGRTDERQQDVDDLERRVSQYKVLHRRIEHDDGRNQGRQSQLARHNAVHLRTRRLTAAQNAKLPQHRHPKSPRKPSKPTQLVLLRAQRSRWQLPLSSTVMKGHDTVARSL